MIVKLNPDWSENMVNISLKALIKVLSKYTDIGHEICFQSTNYNDQIYLSIEHGEFSGSLYYDGPENYAFNVSPVWFQILQQASDLALENTGALTSNFENDEPSPY